MLSYLGVTEQLLSHVRDNSSTCFFLPVLALEKFRGNAPHPKKLDPLLHSLSREEDGLLDLPLPILVVNCSSSTAVLIEGNNRLEAFRLLRRQWFPVVVRVEDCCVSLKASSVRFPVPTSLNDELMWMRKETWNAKTAYVLVDVFGLTI